MRRGVAALLLLVAGVPATSSAAPADVKLGVGQAAFWDVRGASSWDVEVRGRGARLRVAVDDGHPVDVTLTSPSGAQSRASGSYSAEVLVPNPEPGVWRIDAATSPTGRVRAKVEAAAPARRGNRPLLPNLRLIPPYEFTFTLPGAAGCQPDEIVEHSARTCLRFSLGPENTGDGPLRLRYSPLEGIADKGQVFQVVQRADDTTYERLAGTFEYHKTHAHYHHSGFGSLELFKVTDPRRGTMTRAGTGPKQGFCMLDLKLAEWRSFYQDPAGRVEQDCGALPVGTTLGLGRGWGDIYTFNLSGNYVEWGTNTDGRYVVRSVADALGQVQETNEADNAGYAYVEVTGSTVRVLERGRGMSPWDPRKVLVDDRMPPNP